MTGIDNKLQAGIDKFNQGNTADARQYFEDVLELDPYSESAWLWLSRVVDDEDDKKTCLENVLTINPENTEAKAYFSETSDSQPTSPFSTDFDDDPFTYDEWWDSVSDNSTDTNPFAKSPFQSLSSSRFGTSYRTGNRQADESLRRAIETYRRGQISRAKSLFQDIDFPDTDNELWEIRQIWLCMVHEDTNNKRDHLNALLQQNKDNRFAQLGLELMDATLTLDNLDLFLSYRELTLNPNSDANYPTNIEFYSGLKNHITEELETLLATFELIRTHQEELQKQVPYDEIIEQLNDLSLVGINELLLQIIKWTRSFDEISDGFAVEIISDAIKLSGWINPTLARISNSMQQTNSDRINHESS